MLIQQATRRIRRHLPSRLYYDLKSLSRVGRPVGRLPDFVLIGAQKGGTTALFDMLSQHPDVCPSVVKEVHYFDINVHRGSDWYRRHFPVDEGKVTGEASPYYLFHPSVPARLKTLVPSAKIIAILRNPVERSLSHYFHSRRRGHETLPMLQAFEAEETRLADEQSKLADPNYISYSHQHHSYVARSRYMEQLERWTDMDLLVLSNSQLRRAPDETFEEVCRFIGVPAVPAPTLEKALGGEKGEVDPAALRYLEERLAGEKEAVESAYDIRL